MDGHRAKRLRLECPICHRAFERGLESHLSTEHTREDLVRQIVTSLEAEADETNGHTRRYSVVGGGA